MKTIVIAACAVVLILIVTLAVTSKFAGREPMTGPAPVANSTRPSKQLWTCGMHPQVIQDHPGNCPICHMKLVPMRPDFGDGAEPSADQNNSAGPTVRIDPTIVQNMGVRLAEVARGPLSKTVRAVGILEVPENAQYDINLKVSGWIRKLYANQEGMHVHKGDPLFDLYSPELQVAAEELIGAIQAFKTLDSKSSDAVRAEAQSLIDSAKQKLRLWGLADQDIETIARADKPPETVPFRDPADGDLVDKMVVEGSAVQAGMKIMRIEGHTKLWLNAQVYENDMAQVELGQTVEATVDAAPGKTFIGPISFIHPHLDHMTRTVMVRVTLDNPTHQLSPGMYATANIKTEPVADAVRVPREAVIDTGTRQIAFVALTEGHFEPRKVRMGVMGDDDRVQILEGLAPGEVVVTSGQFLLDVESRTTEAIDKMRQSTKHMNEPSEMKGTEEGMAQ